MARNKYPEATVEKILNAAQRLFLEKGYEKTTIQDIVDALGGLTKGAIYHHFRSKDEIMNALCDKMLLDNNPFTQVKQRRELNGLQKMRAAILLNFEDTERGELMIQALPILKNPRILAEMLETNRRLLTPFWLELIEEGVADGSLHTEYAREIAELLPLVTDIWASPQIFPATREETFRKLDFIKELLDRLDIPVLDDALLAQVKAQVSKIYFSPPQERA